MPSIKSLAHQLMPPVLYQWAERLSQSQKHALYPSYEAALQHCSSDGYENETLVNVMQYKMAQYLAQRTAGNTEPILNATQAFTLLSVAKLVAAFPEQKTFRILDFGGSLGGHYYDVKTLFERNISLQ
jgi:putative methyltransferase (TIGR04325 family)